MRTRFRSLLAQSILWIALPIVLVMMSAIIAGVLAYQQVVTSLLIDRDRQLATLSAHQISEAADGYGRVLQALASNTDVSSPSAQKRMAAVENASEALGIFSAGVMIAAPNGTLLTSVPIGAEPDGTNVASRNYFISARDGLLPAFSDVITDVQTADDMVVIAVPILDEANRATGKVLMGAIQLHNTPFGDPVKNLIVGDQGFGVLVDARGRVIFDPQTENIGADFTNRPFVQRVMNGETGGALWTSPTGERLVIGYAPVEATGWGLVVREPWQAVIAPVEVYGVAVTIAGLGAVLACTFLLWRGVRRITNPIQSLAAQTTRLAQGEAVEPIAPSGILEIDTLEQAFGQMATQIASYRAGLRRYVGAITTSQEDERRRIARDLHDATIQSLLAIARRLELYQASEENPTGAARWTELQTMVADTLREVRLISRDLRPLALEDLGLIPALRTLIHSALDANGASPHVKLDIVGSPSGLKPEQELALYRITQESLTNIHKHAQASNVSIALTFGPRQVQLQIQDNGVGFEAPSSLSVFAQQGSFGLMGIQERVWAVGGWLSIHSVHGQGTGLSITIPIGPTDG
jgi:signal transduction histidine kinase